MTAREHLWAFAERVMSYSTSLEALWLARKLFERWPARKRPQPLRLYRRPEATAEQWATLREQLEAARTELGQAGVPTRLEWNGQIATVTIDDGPRQLDIFDELEGVST
jgi:hypothetical protein